MLTKQVPLGAAAAVAFLGPRGGTMSQQQLDLEGGGVTPPAAAAADIISEGGYHPPPQH